MSGLLKRLENGGTVVVAEGYIFEFERRGYLQAGTFVPEVVLEHPDLVRQLYEEFVHAGSDVVLALTYYAHREKLRHAGRENDLEAMNIAALKMAREVADKHGALMAGNICNSTLYHKDEPDSFTKVENVFKEQIEIAVKYGADFIVGETFGHYGEAKIALESIKKYGGGIPAVITFTSPPGNILHDDIHVAEACKLLEDGGAAVVGLNCGRGPATMLPVLKDLKKACKGPVAALPVTYRTNEEQPTFFNLTAPGTDNRAFPLDLTACVCSRTEINNLAMECKSLGIEYIGLCCGNASNLLRIVAEVYEKNPVASKYSPDMSKHYIFGENSKSGEYYTSQYKQLITSKVGQK